MIDSFDEFRKQGMAQASQEKAAPDLVINRPARQPYEAFAAKDKVLRLDIRCPSSDMGHSLPYNYITNITYKLSDYSEIFLTVSGITVTITGKNLRPVVEALKLHTCEFIQEYSSDKFIEHGDRNKPFVSSITIAVIGR
ncbi:hypothetical protein SAMN05216403_1378 [Nitrosospira multiformis ATCC 25196]|uniref:Uncharacterized protein n=1 Tax=Nitrosospira multiformis (strain ATCC 25196 / NCIMB 11849 / C 71) TaxID=323848 RepID=Q2Y5A2_NITMU|nr:hypothetical protein [Nitrosospira multiformis]ABB76069.1 hypothetical protein Nmul_B2798 [Nitrosospira multiformis ATCC 25196]SEG15286.1 hypothetical protein SAMN05216403_1378 [Nitrosospira multiformis ATCC 25196]